MSLPRAFWEQLPLKTDAELYDMLAHQDDYQPEALTAAKEELRKSGSSRLKPLRNSKPKFSPRRQPQRPRFKNRWAGPCGSSFSFSAPVFLGRC